MLAGVVLQPKRKPKGFAMKKDAAKKTRAVMVTYDDDTTEELPVS